jgi:hypothetical protein
MVDGVKETTMGWMSRFRGFAKAEPAWNETVINGHWHAVGV